MNNLPEGTRDFEEVEKKIVELTKIGLSEFYPLYWKGINLLKDAIALLIQEETLNSNKNEVTYAKVLLLLLNRSIQHLESIRLLLERGLYGDSSSLIRNIMSDSNMIAYLYYHPELIERFYNEKEDDYHSKDRKFQKLFGEGVIESDLARRGLSKYGKVFSTFSKASHASAFGAQMYGSESRNIDGQYHFNYGPFFEAKKSLRYSMSLIAAFMDLNNGILCHKEREGNGYIPLSWKEIEKRMVSYDSEAVSYIEAVKQTLPNLERYIKSRKDSNRNNS